VGFISHLADVFVRLADDPAPTPRPTDINGLPLPVRANIVTLARAGMPHAEIAARFEIPVTWVMLLAETPPGSTEH
jgi:DNA-directed RNA polymerase specialized sigma24 family protein